MSNYTVILETTEPFGPEVQVMHQEAEDAREAALRALHDWHTLDFEGTTRIEELEDGSVRVLTVLKGHNEAVLTRNPSQKLV
jgi:hypothetical protein